MDFTQKRKALKLKLRNREKMFAGWVSFSHPSITEIFARAGFDFIAIDMEHSTISLEQGLKIISSSQALGVPCLPRPVSHSNDWFKPLLESGADGLLVQMVNTTEELEKIIAYLKYPPIGNRSYGVARAQSYGYDFNDYTRDWNDTSNLIIQIESTQAVENIDDLLSYQEVDGVMIGPYDLSGSLGVPGQTDHELVKKSCKKVIEACKQHKISCGIQLSSIDVESIQNTFEEGFTFIIMASDLFVLWKWAEAMQEIMRKFR